MLAKYIKKNPYIKTLKSHTTFITIKGMIICINYIMHNKILFCVFVFQIQKTNNVC